MVNKQRGNEMIKFNVYAGNMLCGWLTVVIGHSHNYLSRSNSVICHRYAIGKVAGYKHLRLERV